MKKTNLLPLVVAVCLITSIITYLAVQWITIDSIQRVDMYITVEDVYGLNVDSDALYFGSVPPGAGSMRQLTFEGDEQGHMIHLEAYGDMAGWTSVSNNNFWLEPHQQANITVSVNVPRGVPYGKYRGVLKATMKKG